MIILAITITIILALLLAREVGLGTRPGTTVPIEACDGMAEDLLEDVRGNHLSNTTCLTQALFKSGEECGNV